MHFSFKFFTLILSTAFLISCSESKPTGGGSSTGGTGGGSNTGSSSNIPFVVEVRANYEDNSAKKLFGTCEFAATDPVGSTKSCTIQLPELLLYNSRLEFYVATNSKDTCRKVSFFPYYYLKSSSATFPKDGEPSTVDCSLPSATNPSDSYCWGGAAGSMIEPEFSFPASKGLYFLTVNQLSQKYLFESTDKMQDTNADRTMSTNSVMANTLPPASRGPAINNSLVRFIGGANNFNDYDFICWDEWANINYRFTITISDDDSFNAPVDTPRDFYWDWGF